jgi:ubiquinol-cytochrome c reductase cytochrome b subunit
MLLVGFIKDLVFFLPSRKTLSYSWNFGMMLGLVLFFQIFTGVFLVFFYTPDSGLAFFRVQYIMTEANFG